MSSRANKRIAILSNHLQACVETHEEALAPQCTYGQAEKTKVLSGIRVLDFGRYIAGPFCAALLGDFGADVIRIEKVSGSEDRFLAPVDQDDGSGALFLQNNRNKRGMTLNPMKPEGRAILQKLVATADVVIANLPSDSLRAMGLDYEALRAVKPDVILATVSTFGSKGPRSQWVGFDGIAAAMSGMMHMTGHADEPMKAATPWVDFGTATITAFGVMAALRHRDLTGEGQVVEGSLLATALTFNNSALIEQALMELNREASGNRSQGAGPADVFKCRDGKHLLTQVIGRPLWERWCTLVKEKSWIHDPRFATDELRGEHGDMLSARMQQWCDGHDRDDAISLLQSARIPAGPCHTYADALVDDHIVKGQFFQSIRYDSDRDIPVSKTHVSLSRAVQPVLNRPPRLGEHTDIILKEIGYTDTQIRALRSSRVV